MTIQEFLREEQCFKFLKWIEVIQQENLAVKLDSMYILEKDKTSCELIFIDGNGNKRKVTTSSSIDELKEYFPLLDLSNLSNDDIQLWKQQLGGLDGESATVNIGSVTTLNPDQQATVTNSGNTLNAIFNFGIPKGEKGDTGYKTIDPFPLTKTDPSPAILGWYKPTDAGTYANAGGLVAQSGYDTLFYYDGSTWTRTQTLLPAVSISPVFDPNTTTVAQGGKQIADRYDPANKVLKSFLNTQTMQWDEITMPTSGEKDNAVIILPSYSQHTETGWANGFIPLSEFSGYEFIKIEGDLSAYGSSEIIWLGRGNDTTNQYGTYLTGIPTNNVFQMNVPTGAIEYIIYSRKKGDTKIYKGKTINVPIVEDAVKDYIDTEIANIESESNELNFKDFGAVCDGVSNDTQPFKNAINHLISIGGGKIKLDGTIKITQTAIPFVDFDKFMTIEIVGDYVPTGVFGSVGSVPINTKNSTILCEDTSYDDLKGVIYTTKGAGPWAFNYMTFVLRNLVVRTTDGAPIHALNLYNFQQSILENVNIDTGIYAGQAAEPINESVGLIMPARDNGALCIANNVYISGYNIAMIPQEHTNADNIQINCCKVALRIQGAGHPIFIKRVLAQKCTRIIEVTNQANFEIQQLVIEKASPTTITPGHEWQLPDTYDFYDTGNAGRGFITWNSTIGGVTLNGTFNRTGGSNVKSRRLGDVNWV